MPRERKGDVDRGSIVTDRNPRTVGTADRRSTRSLTGEPYVSFRTGTFDEGRSALAIDHERGEAPRP